jgi:hypothetical protein
MLTTEKAHFDTDVMVAFAKAATMVPIGSWVELEDGRIGYSSRRYPGRNLPWIRLVMSGSGAPLASFEDIDPGMSGMRIKRLLAANDLVSLNPSFAGLVTG